MNLWSIERLRFTRTQRWVPVLAVFGVFGVTGPVVARYLQALVRRSGGSRIRIIAPPPIPADAVRSFLGNAQQFGVLAVTIIAAGAMAFDARPEMAMFLRTRVRGTIRLLVPKFVTNAIVAAGGFAVGIAIAWVLTAALIGRLPAAAMLEGTALWALYLAFVVALVGLTAATVRSQLAAVLVAVGSLIALGVAGAFPQARDWVPTALAGALSSLIAGVPLSRFLPAILITCAATPALLVVAARLLDRREL